MNQSKKRVVVSLKTRIWDKAGTTGNEQNKMKIAGVFMCKGGLDVVSFKEKMDELEVTTLITITPEKVSIKRSGAVSMHQQFRLGQVTENVYKHPHGNLHMETFTKNMVYEKLHPHITARLTMDYTVKLNGQEERSHTLELVIKEEEAE